VLGRLIRSDDSPGAATTGANKLLTFLVPLLSLPDITATTPKLNEAMNDTDVQTGAAQGDHVSSPLLHHKESPFFAAAPVCTSVSLIASLTPVWSR
jgi:hypothetical protein